MKPLFILLGAFGISLISIKIFQGNWSLIFSGNLAMSIMLLFTAIGHFKFPKGMAMMIPGFIPFKIELVLFTGIIEIVAATGLMLPSKRYITSIMLIVFFFSILPANINAAIKKIDFENATTTGKGIDYLWFRIPLQVLFIAWVWYFGIYKS